MALSGELTDICPDCTHPAIHKFLMVLNDKMPEEPRQRLWIYGLRALGTFDQDSVELGFKFADVAVRIFAADALESAGLNKEAESLRDLNRIDSENTVAYDAAAADAADAAAYAYDEWTPVFNFLDQLLLAS